MVMTPMEASADEKQTDIKKPCFIEQGFLMTCLNQRSTALTAGATLFSTCMAISTGL